MRRFEGRTAVVSGAAQGIGKAVALRLGDEGATVIAVDLNGQGAAVTAKAIGGKSISLQCDIGDPDSVSKLFSAVAGKSGKLDVLVNAAAIVPFVKWDELTFEEWRRVMRVNLDGLYLTVHLFNCIGVSFGSKNNDKKGYPVMPISSRHR